MGSLIGLKGQVGLLLFAWAPTQQGNLGNTSLPFHESGGRAVPRLWLLPST